MRAARGRVDDGGVDCDAVDECMDAEVEVGLRAGDGGAEVGVGGLLAKGKALNSCPLAGDDLSLRGCGREAPRSRLTQLRHVRVGVQPL
jgi:hypothetical protein